MSWSIIEEFAKSKGPRLARPAEELLKAGSETRCKLIDDEKRLAESLSINISLRPTVVLYYKNTERVSIGWRASTSSANDARHWAELCPPNDIAKRKKVNEHFFSSTLERYF